jgi:hypothetical protein
VYLLFHYAECYNALWHYVKVIMLSVIMFKVIMEFHNV